MPLVGPPRAPSTNTPSEQAVRRSQHVASLYIARRKVWEGRAATHQEASKLAEEEKRKYPHTKSTVVIRESV